MNSKNDWFFSGAFNPVQEDPLPGHKKTQLILKIISGQQLPKPKDSMFGDRGEVINITTNVKFVFQKKVFSSKFMLLWF